MNYVEKEDALIQTNLGYYKAKYGVPLVRIANEKTNTAFWWFLKFEGIEPMSTTIRISDRARETCQSAGFYPFRRILFKTKVLLQKIRFKMNGWPIHSCACGEGVATWRIDNPNHSSNRLKGDRSTWLCCDDCVGFYDLNLSRRRLKGIDTVIKEFLKKEFQIKKKEKEKK